MTVSVRVLVSGQNMLFQEPSELLSPDNATGGASPVLQIFYDSFMSHFGSAAGAILLGVVVLISAYLCNLPIMTCGSR